MVQQLDYYSMGLCNCARCDRECVGEKTQMLLASIPSAHWPFRVRQMPTVVGRIDGRPYCAYCFAVANNRKPIGAPPQVIRDERLGILRG